MSCLLYMLEGAHKVVYYICWRGLVSCLLTVYCTRITAGSICTVSMEDVCLLKKKWKGIRKEIKIGVTKKRKEERIWIGTHTKKLILLPVKTDKRQCPPIM